MNTGTARAKAPPQQEMLGIQEAAKLLGVTMRALRFYEDKGLIAPQRVGTTRIYAKREIARMQLILRGKRLGFTLREIREFLDLYDVDPQHMEQMRQLAAKAGERMRELRGQQRAIEQTIEELLVIERDARIWVERAMAQPARSGDQSGD